MLFEPQRRRIAHLEFDRLLVVDDFHFGYQGTVRQIVVKMTEHFGNLALVDIVGVPPDELGEFPLKLVARFGVV
ncbi:MAG: hypothetical protein ACOCV2_03270 [Persicimonas sp.]